MSAGSPPDLRTPPYLPHLASGEVLQMGLSPLADAPWIETDSDLPRYHSHKLAERRRNEKAVYRTEAGSEPAQEELATLLLAHLTQEQPAWYELRDNTLCYKPAGLEMPVTGDEPLWQASLWVADDLVLMAPCGGDYRLVAASLCSPSHWRLADKFGCPLADIHAPIPDFAATLTPGVQRFFAHLQTRHPVVRYNWSLQATDELHPDPEEHGAVAPETALYYRTERQSLCRLPRSGAVAFTIRVYLHPLDCVGAHPDAMAALLEAVAATPPALAHYKGFDRLAPALEKYRPAGRGG
ncbi:MAG: DUF3445 domain-containing protein [Halioglobus sp.]|nr:DUF3445 domain-containing protein [Halioglobus sp.]